MSQSFRVKPRRAMDHSNRWNNVSSSLDSPYIRPSSADGGKRNKPSSTKRHHSSAGKPGFRNKLAKKFLKPRDDDSKQPKIPPGFYDEYETTHRSVSPDSPFQRNRYYSLGSRTALKIKRIGKEKEEAFFMWKPCKRKCEWESMSGRQFSITDTVVGQVSKMELNALQRLSISRLQGMDIGVSHGMIKDRNGKLGKLSNSMRRRVSNDRPISTAVFGQPLTAVIDNQRINKGGMCSPTIPYPPAGPLSTYQNHPDQPVAVRDEDQVDTPLSYSLGYLEGDAPDAKPSSPISPRHDSLLHPHDQHLVPLIVQKAIHYLDQNGIKTEGIFRVPGAKARIDEIRRQFDEGDDVDIPDDANPHDVACLFKEFFRSLPEPLMTRDLYYPLLQTRKLHSRSQQKEALQLLCLLLPRPNRDTLQELVQFLSRVALHSNDTILLDGTEEAGNRMTSQNIAMVLGPNIIHNECKRKNAQAAYQVTRADPEELTAVCNVMEDLILFHDYIFKVPAELHDTALRDLFLTNHESVDVILKQKCENSSPIQDTLTLKSHDVLRSKSSDCLRQAQAVSLMTDMPPNGWGHGVWHQRARSFSDTERSLDVLMKNIEHMLSEDLPSVNGHTHHSSDDSAMGESECITSPCQHHTLNNGTYHAPSLYNSVDSAISNHSSQQFSSCEGVAYTQVDPPTHHSPVSAHIRMCSEMSVQSESPLPSLSSPVPSPKFVPRVSPFYRGSLPVLTPVDNHGNRSSSSPFRFMRKLRKSSSTNSGKGLWSRRRRITKTTPRGSVDNNMPEYHLQRSPLLGRKFEWGRDQKAGPDKLQELEVLTDETLQGIEPRFHYVIQPASEVLI